MHDPFAYLDAGSGSMIIQIIVGGFAAAAVSLKLFWKRILQFLHIRPKDEEQVAEPAPATAAQPESREGDQPAVVETR